MSHLDSVTVDTPQRSQQEMLKDHNQILQNYFDTYIARGLSQRTRDETCRFVELPGHPFFLGTLFVMFGRGDRFVNRRDLGGGRKRQLHFTACQRAGELRNEEIRRVRIILCVLSILEPEYIARILNDQVLEPAAGAETRNSVLAGIADSPERFVHIFIGAARNHPDAGETLEQRFVYFICGYPNATDIT
jgi:hypothetical protein